MANNSPKTHRHVSFPGQEMANKTSRSSPDAHSSAIVEKYGLVSVDKYPRTVEHFLDLMWWEASRQPQTYKCWSAGTDTKGYVFLLFAHK